MFSRQRGASAFSIFKWKHPGASSLTTALLQEDLPEIELSDYGKIPSPGSESPSGLLNGESLNVEPISDLDLFSERLYSYYCEKGLWCIVIKWIVELLSLGFTICFSGFFLLYVDWNGLRNAKCGMDAVESGIKPCDLAKEALHQHPLTPLTLTKSIIVGYLGIFSIYLIFCFLRFFAQLKDTLEIRHFYYNKHAEQFYNHPSTASSQRWSNLSRWIFREFNEVDHLFKHRINCGVLHASDYLKQFPSPIISIIAKFISFVSGGFAAILIIIAFLEESLLEGHVFGRNLFWYAAVFGTITAISRAAITNEVLVLDADGAMSMVVQHTHYMPKRWRGKESTEMVHVEFETLFQRVDDILQFIADFTVNVEGVGHVCSFQSSYPSWEPSALGKRFLLNLRRFREETLPVHGNVHAPSPPRMWRGSPNIGDRYRFISREMLYSTRDNHLGSLWLVEANQNNHPYLLDWYYTSRSHDTNPGDVPLEEPFGSHDVNLGDVHLEPFGVIKHSSREFLMAPSNLTQNESGYEEYSDEFHDGWAASHLGTSTSAPIFRKSVIHNQSYNELSHTTSSHWWARSDPRGGQTQTSIFEPPAFNHQTYDYHDKFSDRESEDQDHEQSMYSRDDHRLSRTYTDDLGAGEFNLHFDDIYSRPPETPPASF
ncbi:hypothetical protein JHK82_053811 [Glycine max]|nr:hypothetical protein JHK85_054611 [Glycine max]KAG5086414.1 hypothetical protein JHK82_053811 [Glycine max]